MIKLYYKSVNDLRKTRQTVAIWRLELIHETQCNGQSLLFLLKSKIYIVLFTSEWLEHVLFSMYIYTFILHLICMKLSQTLHKLQKLIIGL